MPARPTAALIVGPHLFTNDARNVMRLANEEAHRLNHRCVAAEHVLLGLLREGSGVAASMLEKIGRNFSKVRNKLISSMQIATATGTLAKLPYTRECTAVMGLAYKEACDLDASLV